MHKKKFRFSKKIIVACVILALMIFYFAVSYAKRVDNPDYGASFNTMYARELGLNWKEVYDAMLQDLGIRKLRLAAHWNMVEPADDEFSFEEMDYQMAQAAEHGATVVFAVGKRLPRWPECHIPDWAVNMDKDDLEDEISEYVETVVNRYKKYDNITMWQVENEPFLGVFALEHCRGFDKDFLEKEIELVRSLDEKHRPIMVTDSGELSMWFRSFSMADYFGTTMYLYSWNSVMGEFRNWWYLPGFYSFRAHLWQLLGSDTEAIIAELALEPWLDKPVVHEQTAVQIRRMSPEKFERVLEFAKKTGMRTQYLWGAEWWYYMKLQGEDWYWERGKELFSDNLPAS
jgi:hypothetical protein